jgi:cytosine/uracil/thiamine/allantoin permease
VIPLLKPLYDYAWFVGFGVAFVVHLVLMKFVWSAAPMAPLSDAGK